MNKTLGATLKQARELAGYTLRQIEEATGISNAYLSQLENEKIKRPSANVLYKLAKIYRMELDMLLSAGGIIDGEGKINAILAPLPTIDLTKEEERQLLEYLEFLRWKDKQLTPSIK